jgi:hypothetical protein
MIGNIIAFTFAGLFLAAFVVVGWTVGRPPK